MPGYYRKRGDNSYQLEVTIGTDFTGTPVKYRKTVHVTTDKQAEKELAKFYAECESGNIAKPNKLTVKELSDMCMDKIFRPTLRTNTIYGYEVASARLDMIGDKRLNKLTAVHIQEWVNYMANEWNNVRTGEKGLSPKSVMASFSYLNRCINIAIKWGLMNNNPCKHVELPKSPRKEPNYFKEDEMIRFIQVLYDLPRDKMWVRVAALLILFGSFRKGELMGLDVDDFNFNNNTVTSRRARYAKKGGGIFTDETKNETSDRTVALPKEVMDEVKALIAYDKERQLQIGSMWIGSDALLKGFYGEPMNPYRVWENVHRILKENGFTNVGLHGLRHTHASMLISLGEKLPDVSKRMGHKYQSTTMNIYSHVFDQNEAKIADELSNRFLSQKSDTIDDIFDEKSIS